MSSACTPAPRRRRLWSPAAQAWAAFRAFQLRRQYRHAAHILDRLDDNMLKDMGISRDEIHGVVYRPAVSGGAGGEDPLG
jgi:uncharacterized protein YjiS (DUF1127 family)